MTRAARVYDFTLSANGAAVILAEGSFYRIMSATGAVEVRRNNGSLVGPLLPGQGERAEFISLTITDKSGAANAGTILIADDTFIDERISGEVAVIDAGFLSTRSGAAFMASRVLAASAGLYSHVGLWNPLGSGVDCYVKAIMFCGFTSGNYELRVMDTALTDTYTPSNKKIGAAVGAVQGRSQYDVAVLGGAVLYKIYAGTSTPTVYEPAEPICLTPGNGILAMPVTANAVMQANFDYIEVPAL